MTSETELRYWRAEAEKARAVSDAVLAQLRRAEYHLVGQEYLDALAVIRAALTRYSRNCAGMTDTGGTGNHKVVV